MEKTTIQAYRRKLRPLLPRYLLAAGKGYRDGMLRCPRCGKSGFYREDLGPYGEGGWYCHDCNAAGDTLDYVMLENPSYDESAAIRHIYRVLGLKITTLETVCASDLLRMQLPEQQFLVDGLLGKGLYLLSGASKIGKSWMVLDLANRISKGEEVFGRQTHPCPVLYVSLEDTLARLQERLGQVTGGKPGPVYLSTEAELMNHGFEEQLVTFLEAHREVKLVIIDTLQKIRELGRENYSYAGDYAVTGVLKELADRYGLTMLLVHHNRKQDSLDPLDKISGTSGIAGGVDGYWLLNKRSRSSSDAILTIGGRDLEDQSLELRFDKERKQWQYLGLYTGSAAVSRELLEKTADLADKNWSGTMTELQTALDLGEMAPAQLGRQLSAAEACLKRDYGVNLEKNRSNTARTVSFTRDTSPVTGDSGERPREKNSCHPLSPVTGDDPAGSRQRTSAGAGP